jgi:hypothetical protein
MMSYDLQRERLVLAPGVTASLTRAEGLSRTDPCFLVEFTYIRSSQQKEPIYRQLLRFLAWKTLVSCTSCVLQLFYLLDTSATATSIWQSYR